jgi:DNA repair protein RecN (Recombination protein N)
MAVVYDEIDAHVGGHAAVSVANMLVDQSRSGQQVIAITHSPSVGAVADTHLVVRCRDDNDSNVRRNIMNEISVDCVTGSERRKELARMASGNLALEEAEVFAEALIRDAAATKLSP